MIAHIKACGSNEYSKSSKKFYMLKLAEKANAKIYTADRAFLKSDLGYDLKECFLPFKPAGGKGVIADFDGLLPHFTGPVWGEDAEGEKSAKNLQHPVSSKDMMALLEESNERWAKDGGKAVAAAAVAAVSGKGGGSWSCRVVSAAMSCRGR